MVGYYEVNGSFYNRAVALLLFRYILLTQSVFFRLIVRVLYERLANHRNTGRTGFKRYDGTNS